MIAQFLHTRYPEHEITFRHYPSGATNGRAWIELDEEVVAAPEAIRYPVSIEHIQPLSADDFMRLMIAHSETLFAGLEDFCLLAGEAD